MIEAAAVSPPPIRDWGFTPGLDPLMIAVLAMSVIWMSLREWRVRRRWALLGIMPVRLVAVGGIVLVLAGPSRHPASEIMVKPSVMLLVDHSRSMSLPDAEAGCSRLESAMRTWLSTGSLRSLRELATVSATAVADVSTAIALTDLSALEADGKQSRLAAGLRRAADRPARPMQDAPLHLVLFSDGVDTDGLALAPPPSPTGSPGVVVHAVVPGVSAAPDELLVDAWFDRAWVMLGEPAALNVEVVSRDPNTSPGAFALVIREGDGEGEVVAERGLVRGNRERFSIPVTPRVSPAPGGIAAARFTATIERWDAPSGERIAGDSAFIQVTGRRVRVLIIENEPTWDARFFVDALSAEPDFEVTTVYGLSGAEATSPRTRVTSIIPGPEQSIRRVGGAVPATADELGEYDVIVLGRGARRLLTQEAGDGLMSLIERGGGLLWLRETGDQRRAPEWDSLFPAWIIRDTRVVRQIAIRASDRDAADEQTIIRVSEIRLGEPSLKPAARVVWSAIRTMMDEGVPVAAEMPVGAGLVAGVFGEGLWRAAIENEHGAEATRGLWAGLVRRLASGGESPPGAAGSLSILRTEAAPGDSVRVIVRVRRAHADLSGQSLLLIAPDGRVTRAPLTPEQPDGLRWTASVRPQVEGDHTVRLELPAAIDRADAVLESKFSVRVRDIEMRDTAPRVEELEALAEATGGRTWRAATPDFEAFLSLLKRETIARQGPPVIEPMWDRPWVFAAILFLLGVEWWWRRREGMP